MLYKFRAGQARMLLSLIPPKYIEDIQMHRLNPASKKYLGKEQKDSLFKIAIKLDTLDVNNGEEIRFADICNLAFQKGETIEHFKKWLVGSIEQYIRGRKQFYEGVDGVVIVYFVVMEDGTLGDIDIKQSTNPKLNEIILRSLKSSPKWIPATINGKPIKFNCAIPIKFRTPQ